MFLPFATLSFSVGAIVDGDPVKCHSRTQRERLTSVRNCVFSDSKANKPQDEQVLLWYSEPLRRSQRTAVKLFMWRRLDFAILLSSTLSCSPEKHIFSWYVTLAHVNLLWEPPPSCPPQHIPKYSPDLPPHTHTHTIQTVLINKKQHIL